MSDSHETATVTVKSNLKQVLQASAEAIDRGLMACGMEAVTLTHRDKNNNGTPVDTGRLRNSIAWAVADQSGGGTDAGNTGTVPNGVLVIGTNVEYARYIEEGTYNAHAYHMLRNALVDGADRYEKILQAAMAADK